MDNDPTLSELVKKTEVGFAAVVVAMTSSFSASDGSNAENPSRIEAERVVHGGTNELKEFPS